MLPDRQLANRLQAIRQTIDKPPAIDWQPTGNQLGGANSILYIAAFRTFRDEKKATEMDNVSAARTPPSFSELMGEYLSLCKPKVVALIVFTAIIGMFLAVPGMVPLDVHGVTTDAQPLHRPPGRTAA